jgi:hypothetical protein
MAPTLEQVAGRNMERERDRQRENLAEAKQQSHTHVALPPSPNSTGKGYLGQLLAAKYGLDVVGVESCGDRNERAVKRATKLAGLVRKKQAAETGQVSAVTLHVTAAAVSKLPACSGAVLAGLHTCGDLGPMLLRVFLATDAVAVVSVGCCYQWLSEPGFPAQDWAGDGAEDGEGEAAEAEAEAEGGSAGRDDGASNEEGAAAATSATTAATPAAVEEDGFPLSECVQSALDGLAIGRMGRELACHSWQTWADTDDVKMHGHFHRALFERVLYGLVPAHEPRQVRVGRMRLKGDERHDSGVGFATFCKFSLACLRRMHVPVPQPDPEQYLREIYESETASARMVAAVYSLRLLVGAVVEALILRDRALFLAEQLGPDARCVQLLPLFDPHHSPRSFAVVAIKPPAPPPVTSTGDAQK